ncbi:MAG: thioredoxin, partial [Acidimicrobiia bacterium]
DDPSFFADLDPVDDGSLAVSYFHDIETVPTLLSVRGGIESARAVGWSRAQWRTLTGHERLGEQLPEYRPGCGSLSVDPTMADVLAVRFGGSVLRSRRVEVATLEDEFEAMYERGWSDGLPLVPPTEPRVLRMLSGTTRAADEVVAVVPPDLVECTVEKVAINAVMAGCRPDYLPVVLAAVEAVCTDRFNMHGVLATTMPVGPVFVVNGPVTKSLGMNSGVNVLGQGNRANLAIGRAVQLVIRNVGGGAPGGVDRAAHGNPGKLSACFAEDEAGSPWEPLSVSRGVPAGASAVTVFAAEGPRSVVDQRSRTAEELVRSFAACMRAIHHPKLFQGEDVLVVVGPEHASRFREAGWSRAELVARLHALCTADGADLVAGVDGNAVGVAAEQADRRYEKFSRDGILVVHAGGSAGLFSAVMGGWKNGPGGSSPTTVEVRT